ncbi:MAG: hypothetical protein R6T96_08985 [Longimicrobiales bacterium]
MLWRMAWRNLWRHRTRTVIMTSAVAFSYALFLVSMGMGDDGHQQMLDAAAEGAGGDILVHADGYWASRSSDLVIRNAEEILPSIASTQGVETAIPRVIVNGLVSSPVGNRPLMLQGIDPMRELALRDFSEDMKEGEYLTESTRDDPLVLGVTIVEKLELELGDRVVVTASGLTGRSPGPSSTSRVYWSRACRKWTRTWASPPSRPPGRPCPWRACSPRWAWFRIRTFVQRR